MMKVFVVKYFLFGDSTEAVVIAKNIKSAIDFVISDDVLASDVVGCREVYEEGKVLSFSQQ